MPGTHPTASRHNTCSTTAYEAPRAALDAAEADISARAKVHFATRFHAACTRTLQHSHHVSDARLVCPRCEGSCAGVLVGPAEASCSAAGGDGRSRCNAANMDPATRPRMWQAKDLTLQHMGC